MNHSSLLEIFKTKKLDAILLSSPSHISYLTSYLGFSQTERDAFLLITSTHAYLFSNPLLSSELAKKIKGVVVIEHNRSQPFAKNLAEVVLKEKLKVIGFENDNLTVLEYLTITEHIESRFVSVDVSSIRSIKTKEEIIDIKKACELATKAYFKTKSKIKPGITEKEVAMFFELEVLKNDACLSFPTIVAFGKNSAVPHHLPDATKLKTNDIVLTDFGVKYNNYCSDITRTFFIGKPQAEQLKVIEIVQASQKMAAEFIENALEEKREILASEVDDIAREYIIEKGYPTIPHSLGHGIGIEVHEAPSLSPASNDKIKEGMVFSLEPGIYIEEKFGIRIEDLYTISEAKLVKLT